MCIHPLRIRNPYNGSYYEVDCRRCVECLYNKSRNMFERLINFKDFSKHNILFVTLTYSNSYVPYIRLSDFDDFFNYGVMPSLYRDLSQRRFKSHGKNLVKYYHNLSEPFKYASRFETIYDLNGLSTLCISTLSNNRVFDDDKVGVLDFSDVQKLNKSLRHYTDFEFYCVGEYGEKYNRPHWHILYYLPLNFPINSFGRLLKYFWFRSDSKNVVIKNVVSAEKYVSMYLTKLSHLPPVYYKLQSRFAFMSRALSSAFGYDLDSLDDSLHYHIVRNGKVTIRLPTTSFVSHIFPKHKYPYHVDTWDDVFSSFFNSPSYRQSNNLRKSKNLSQLYDYSISYSRFRSALASQRLKDYLTESPTVYNSHKLECLESRTLKFKYGINDSRSRHFLRQYPLIHYFDISSISKFNIKTHINNLTYGINK